MGLFVKFSFFFFFVFLVGQAHARKKAEQDSSRADYFLDESFKTNQSDSIHFLLDLAIIYGKREENIDAYVEALVEKALEYVRSQQGDSSNKYMQLALQEARRLDPSTKILAKIHSQYGYHIGNQNQYLASLSHLDTAANLHLSISDSLSYADALTRIGALYDNNGNQVKALEYYLQASKIYEKNQDSTVYAGVINNVAVVYKKLGDLEGALAYYDKSYKLNVDMGNELGIAISELNRGMLYKEMGRHDEALSGVKSALNTFQQVKMSYGIAVSYHNLSEIHLVLNNLDSVLYYVDRSQEIALDMQYWMIVVSNQIVLAKALRDMGRPDISNKSALRAYELASKHGFLEKQEELTALLASNYEEVKDFATALMYYKEYESIKDSILSNESREQINRLRMAYDLEQKEADIENLELINSYQGAISEKEGKLRHILILGIVFCLVVMTLFFYLYRRQRRYAKALSEQKVQLTGLNKEKDDLIAMVAHDLRSPLNNIKGLLSLIKDYDGEEQEKMIQLANQSTDVLRTRINQILDVEAINVGRINLKLTKVKVTDVLNKLVHHVSPEAERKQISFFTNTIKQLTCKADENYLLQVLENLSINAIKFSNQKSEIYVKVTDWGEVVRFEVQDHGQGIPEEEIDQLFTRYAKISTLPTENEPSTGLGLPIVKKYVEAMGGKVWCESEVGEGSTFCIELPK
ncbi:tetratricopeptide repeat-containing sensor histidine kinase [Reichenbachiella carrageenanivorans]|uniref:histidine kinase n=1 Tax=Reichenbachiella carrageenanivorans TaxID=2979869 RepID=A0ABY6D5P5_9BACT|nr:tetratricopeptide repeat-containing sensor histidine kinase [Reichenbachiella carrageenanivorans]UXX81234.1 tetratricopeptide repeat-containing sensor histidine kinase [Reichenbachiella carrageenanivorans]